MARRRRPEGVTFADMPAHLRRFDPEAWLDPRDYAAARVAWCRAHGLSFVDLLLAERAERLRLAGFDDPVRSLPADGEPEGDGDD